MDFNHSLYIVILRHNNELIRILVSMLADSIYGLGGGDSFPLKTLLKFFSNVGTSLPGLNQY